MGMVRAKSVGRWAGVLPAVVLVGLMVFPGMVAAEESPWLQAGDRVVWIGPTWVEREGQFGFVEAQVTSAVGSSAADGSSPLTFRNLGWSGDTVWAESRGIFDPPAAGYQRMIELVKELQPTQVWLAYGQNESQAGPERLPAFIAQYGKLIDDIRGVTKARVTLIIPYRYEAGPAPIRDLRPWNESLTAYGKAITQLSKDKETGLVDLLAIPESAKLTYNGLHPSSEGFTTIGREIVKQLHLKPANSSEGVRKAIVAKNTLFFHRWRPQNITYLTGFRKHEQGNNAVEIAQFDPLVGKAEADIWASVTPKQ